MSIFEDAQGRKAGAGVRAQMRAARAPIEKAIASQKVKGLETVPFASPQARTLAMEEGLAWPSFRAAMPTGGRGFTTADVRRIVKEADAQ
jgi:hypothetical protein